MKRFFKIIVSILLASLFFGFLYFVYIAFNIGNLTMPNFLDFLEPRIIGIVIMSVISLILGLIIYFFFSEQIIDSAKKAESTIENSLESMNLFDLILSIIGIIIGMFIANLFASHISKIPIIGIPLVTIINVIMGYIGHKVARARKSDFKNIFSKVFSKANKADKNIAKIYGRPKILDTSVIIDGRILDILRTGFIEGKLVIPNFVLEELRRIADSSDSLKRNRGRRGLDILNEIQNQSNVPVEIIEWDSNDVDDVDTKLIKVGKKLDGFVVTNDFNLNKVAEFQKVPVLNINDLSRSVKTVVLHGETMNVVIIKDGKENKQGIAYLEDGTMIVVENGNKFIGETVDVIVTSVLQTSAGRMIFAKMKDEKMKMYS